MNQEAEWKECLEDFIVGCGGNYEHSEIKVVDKGEMVIRHKLFSGKETISWDTNNVTKEISKVEHLGR